ncbi:MAG: alpha/beta hydrolase, partial [Rhodobacterales bacterium CG_4_9_14_3_um_filter_71_31]
SAREILGLIRIMDRAAAAAPAAQTPVLVLQGEKDELVAPADVAAVTATLTAPVRTILYPEGWHLLFRDRQKARVWTDVRDWILETAP